MFNKNLSFFTSTWEGIATKTPTNSLHPQLPRQEPQLPGTRHRRQHSHTYQRRQREFQEWAWRGSSYLPGGGGNGSSGCQVVFFRLFMKNLVKFSQWRPCVVSFVESLGICCWNQKHRKKSTIKKKMEIKNGHNKSSYDPKTSFVFLFLNLTPPCLGALRQLPYIYRDASLSARVLESAQAAWEEKLMDFSPMENATLGNVRHDRLKCRYLFT